MKLDFPIVMDEILKAKSTLTQVKFVEKIYEFIGEQGKNYEVSLAKIATHASNLRKGQKVRKKITKGAYDKRVIESMPEYVAKGIIPNLRPEKCEKLIDNLLAVIRADDKIATIVKERMEQAALDHTRLHVFLSEVILYTLQHAWDEDNDQQSSLVTSEASLQKQQIHTHAKIVSRLVAPVSKENYISRPDIERDIAQSLQTNRITIVRGMSGLGKSEVVRYVISTLHTFPTIIYLEFKDDGSKTFEQLIEPVNIPGSNTDEERRACLQTCNEDTIILVDNYNDIENNAFERLCDNSGSARIVFTSQISKEKLEKHSKKYPYSCCVIDIEQEKYRNSTFALAVFCKYAHLSYWNLTDNEKTDVVEICNLVANHTMLVAAIGARMREYEENSSAVLSDLRASVSSCLAQDLPVEYIKDREEGWRTPYEILKKLFKGVLSRQFNERTRQVLGAVILLPLQYRKRTVLEEFVGDLKSASKMEARGCINVLLGDILHLTDDGILELHPLYAQLFSDPSIKFCDEAGEQLKGPIAELTVGFRQHLLRNAAVSNLQQLCKHPFKEMQTLLLRLLYVNNQILIEKATDSGWLSICYKSWLEGYSKEQVVQIQSCINENHHLMGDTREISNEEAKNVFLCDSEKKGSIYPNHVCSIFVLEHEKGRSLWIYDTVDKQSWCVINLQNQRSASDRYYYYGKTYTTLYRQGGDRGTMVGFLMDRSPEVLIIPDKISNTPVTSIAYLGDAAENIVLLCLPSTINHIAKMSFWMSQQLERMVFLGNACTIDYRAFVACYNLKYILFPRDSYIGKDAFSGCQKLSGVVLSEKVQMEVRFSVSPPAVLAKMVSDDALYEQHAGAMTYLYNIHRILSADGEEVLDISGVRPLDYAQFILSYKQAAEQIEEQLDLQPLAKAVCLGSDLCVVTNLHEQGIDEQIWAPSEVLLNKNPQLPPSIIANLPFPPKCKISCKKEKFAQDDALKAEINGVFLHIKWCIHQANLCIEQGDYYLAGEYLLSVDLILQNRSEFFNLKSYSSVMMLLAAGFARCRMYDKAYKHLLQIDVNNIKDKANWLFFSGLVLGKMGNHREALLYKLESLKQSTQRANKATAGTARRDQLDLASDYNSIAESFIALKEYKQAYECLQKCLEIRNALLSPDDLAFALLYENCGDLYFEISTKESIECGQSCYKRAAAIFSAHFGPNHQNVTRVKQKLLSLSAKLKQITE